MGTETNLKLTLVNRSKSTNPESTTKLLIASRLECTDLQYGPHLTLKR